MIIYVVFFCTKYQGFSLLQDSADLQQKQHPQRSSPWQSETQGNISPRILERLDYSSRGNHGSKATFHMREDGRPIPRSGKYG